MGPRSLFGRGRGRQVVRDPVVHLLEINLDEDLGYKILVVDGELKGGYAAARYGLTDSHRWSERR